MKMAVREKREIPIRPLILKFGVAFALSLGGVLHTIFRTKRSKTSRSEDTQPSTDCCNHSDSRGGSFGLEENDPALKDSSTPKLTVPNSISDLSSSNRDTDFLLLPDFEEPIEEHNLDITMANISHPPSQNPKNYILDEQNQEIKTIQEQALNNGLTDGADKGGEDSEGWSALPFACGYGEEKREMPEDKRERGGSSRGGADADDGQSILIVHAYYYLFVLNLKGKQKPDDESPCNPVLLRKKKLMKYGFPLGMGILKLENNRVYMFGGSREWYRTKSRAARKRSRKPSVYELNSRSWSLRFTDEVDSPKAPKADPWQANVDDKILVLQGTSYLGFRSPSPPFLEFYDLTSNTWKEFPKIPTQKSWSKKEEAIIMSGKHSGVLLVGYRMYIIFGDSNRELFFCLNTRTQEWEEENAYNLRESFRKSFLYFPCLGMSVSRIDGLGDGLNIILYYIGT